MTLAEKKAALTRDLTGLPTGQDRLSFLVNRARQRPPLAANERTDDRLLPGCLAKLWFVSEFRDGACFYRCDSDSLVVKAVAGLLCEFYSGQPPAEILAHHPAFLAPLGITQHLTPNRRNALAKVWDHIETFARAHGTAPPAPP